MEGSTVRREVLSNGLRVLVRELRGAPVVALNLWIGVGSADDPEDLSGLSHFTEHMLFRPGPGGQALSLAQTVQDAGGYLNAETGCDHTVYYQVVPPDRWADVLVAQTEPVASPAFDPRDVDDERSVIMEETRGAEADPTSFLWRRLMETVLARHPCGLPIVGTEQTLARITADHLREHHLRHYVTGNMVQVVVGDVDADRVFSVAAECQAAFREGEVTRGPSSVRAPGGVRARSYDGAWEQSSVAVAFRAPPVLNPDVPPLDVACGLLGVGRSSRLKKSLQIGRGLVSDVRSGVIAYRDVGIVAVTAGVVGCEVDRVIEGVFEELERLSAEPVAPGELEKMLRRLEAGYVLEHETAGSIAGGLGLFETLGDYRHFEDYVDRLAAVTPDDVARVARRYLGAGTATVVTYSPRGCGVPAGDRTDEIARLAERAGAGAPVSIAEAGAPWRPTRVFERPMILAERGAGPAERKELAPGATLVFSEGRALPIVSIAVAFRGGFVDEPDDLSGLTYLTQKLVVRGTKRRSADALADGIEGLGSALATAIDRDGFGFGMTLLSEHVREGLVILGEVLMEPALAPDQLDPVRAEVMTEIGQLEDHPLRRAMLLMLPLAFPEHGYGRPLRGTREGVPRIAAADVERWHARLFNPSEMIVSAVGDLDREAVCDAIEDMASRLPRGAPLPAGRAVSLPPSGRTDVVHEGSGQSTIAVAFRGPGAGTRDAAVMRVICRACSMMGGRLWLALRERPPFAYAVGSSLMALRHGGVVLAHVTAPPGQEEAALAGLESEFSRLAEDGLSGQEVERAKRHLAGMLALSIERGAARAASYAMAEATGAGCQHVDRLPELVRSVTEADVAAVARRYLSESEGHATVIVAGGSAE